MPQHTEQFLPDLPKFSHMIPAILCKFNQPFSKQQSLPRERLWVKNIYLPADRIKAFNHIVDWSNEQLVHPCFLHTMAFPMQLKLMLNKAFPFSIMGVVHIANSFEQYQVLQPNSKVDISCSLGEIRKLRIGWLFSIETEVFCNKTQVLKAKHLYLRPINKATESASKIKAVAQWQNSDIDERWNLAATLGWQYANCSDDYNPIHLHPFSAKLLGFRQHIAHGMWLKSRAYSALAQSYPTQMQCALSCEVDFKKPLFLPNEAIFQQRMLTDTEQPLNFEFRIASSNNEPQIEHMTGKIQFK